MKLIDYLDRCQETWMTERRTKMITAYDFFQELHMEVGGMAADHTHEDKRDFAEWMGVLLLRLKYNEDVRDAFIKAVGLEGEL